jgi:hypothetical protein
MVGKKNRRNFDGTPPHIPLKFSRALDLAAPVGKNARVVWQSKAPPEKN